MRRILPIAALALLVVPAAATAAPELTGARGRIAVTYDDEARRIHESFGALATAPDGTVFAAGGSGRARRLAVTAVQPDGTLAPGFGDDGGARAPFDVREGDALLRAADGTLFAVGRLDPGDGSTLGPPAAVRVSPDGTFDRGYGVAAVPGISLIGCPGCGAAALTPDGGLVVAGLAGRGPDEFRFAVSKLRADGSPDPGFGSGGAALPLAGPGGATTLVVQPSGRVVALGFRGPGSDPEAQRTVLVGLRPDGSLDPAFGNQGVVEPADDAFQLAQDSAGRLLVVTVGDEAAVLRFSADGAPDPAWGSGGRAALGRPGVATLVPTPEGAVAAASRGSRFEQVRLDGSGRIAARHTTTLRFGGGSFLPARLGPLGRQSLVPQAIAARPDGSLAIGGSVSVTHEADGGTIDGSEAALALIRADGGLAATPVSGRPRVRAAVRRERLRRIGRRGSLRVRFDPGRRGLARVIAKARGRTVARGMVPFWTARRTTARVRLTPAGRRIVRSAVRLRVRVRVARNDMAGNRGTGAARATLRR